jgi:copper ion binding protein
MKIKVKGMTCQHCVMRVEKALLNVEEVESVNIDLNSGDVSVQFNGDEDIYDKLQSAVKEAGYSIV